MLIYCPLNPGDRGKLDYNIENSCFSSKMY